MYPALHAHETEAGFRESAVQSELVPQPPLAVAHGFGRGEQVYVVPPLTQEVVAALHGLLRQGLGGGLQEMPIVRDAVTV